MIIAVPEQFELHIVVKTKFISERYVEVTKVGVQDPTFTPEL